MPLNRLSLSLLALIVSAAAAISLMAAPGADVPGIPDFGGPSGGGAKPKVIQLKVSAALDRTALQPGKEAKLAIVLDYTEGFHSHSNKPSKEEYIPTTIGSLKATGGVTLGAPSYPAGRNEEFPKMNDTLNVYDKQVRIPLTITVPADAKPGAVTISGVVSAQICNDSMCFAPSDYPFELKTRIAAAGEEVSDANTNLFAPSVPGPSKIAADEKGIVHWFMIAFLVGIIFNIVPCVLPVLPLKAIGFYETAQHNRAKSVTYGLAFSLGVVAAFSALGLLVVVKQVFKWGELFSSPWFAGTLVIILVVMAFNMLGFFTVNLPAGAYAFTPRHDTYFGNFLFGILTAALSTPCTFGLFVSVLTVAIGYPSSTVGLLLVSTVGAGMASPYLILSALPEVARKFPRTGPWAELIKQFMGFFLLAVALFFAQTWIARIADPAITYWLIYAVILGGCVFLMVKSIKYAKTRKAPIVAAVISLVLLVPGFIVVRKLTIKPYVWVPYTPQLLADLQKQDQVVLVEFTATWCANCHTLEAAVINSDAIQAAVKIHNVKMVKADITDQNQEPFKFWKFGIKAEGVPLTLVYPAGKTEPIQLYGIYGADELQKAIEEASKKTAMR